MCSTYMKEKMKEFTSSDYYDPEILTAQAFDNILEGKQISNLSVTTLSAKVSLKKTLVKDRSGSAMLPPLLLQTTVASPSSSLLASSNKNLAILIARNTSLENKLSVQKNKSEAEIKALKQKNKTLAVKLKNKSVEVEYMKCNMNKEKNAVNVALKPAKQDLKAQTKTAENKLNIYEQEINELNDFKIKKLNEERQEL